MKSLPNIIVFTKENQQIPNIKWKKKEKKRLGQIKIKIWSRFDPLDRDQCRDARRGFAVRSMRQWLRCDGATVASMWAERSMRRCDEVAQSGSGWLGTSWAREKARWLGVLGVARDGWGWLGGSGQWKEESRQWRKRERAETEWEWKSRERRDAYFGKWFMEKFSVNHFSYFRLWFSG